MRSPAVSWVKNDEPAYGSIPHRVGVKPRKKFAKPEDGVTVVILFATAEKAVAADAVRTGGGCSW